MNAENSTEKILTGGCHCGAVRFEATFPNGIEKLNRCNCSICSKKGAVMTSVPVANLRISSGEDQLTLYQWNTNIAKHYFCSICGIYTHHQRRCHGDTHRSEQPCTMRVDRVKRTSTNQRFDHPAVNESSINTTFLPSIRLVTNSGMTFSGNW